jgi:putative phosphoesterase
MRIGILSDTHGDCSATAKAARALAGAGVGAVFHCGDIGGMEVLAELAGVFEPAGIPVHAVFGNVDVHSADWRFFPANIGVHLHGRFGDVACADKRVALLHSDDARRFRQVVASGEYDLVLTGHTHEVHDYTRGHTRCINPGTAGRGSPNTCAVLDLKSGVLKVLDLG